MRPSPVLLVATLFAACATPDQSSSIREMEPAALTVAIANVPEFAAGNSEEGLQFTLTNAEFRAELLAGLKDARAASRVFAEDELGSETADVYITPRVTDGVMLAHEGASSGWWSSTGLWLVTWFGGMLMQDSQYTSTLNVAYETEDSAGVKMSRTATSPAQTMSFFERNNFMSWPTAQALVVPPFLTSDQQDVTSAELSKKTTRAVAAEIAKYLKQNFEENSTQCVVRLQQPAANGTTVSGATLEFEVVVTTAMPVTGADIQVNGTATTANVGKSQQDRTASDRYLTTIKASLQGLAPGDNYVRLSLVAGGQFSRTFWFVRSAN